MTITSQGWKNPAPYNFVEISRKDADSIGIGKGEIFNISLPFYYSEGAIDI